MSIVHTLARGMQNRITSRIEQHEMMSPHVVRVVASFNRKPSSNECRQQLVRHFNYHLQPMEHSFRVRKTTNRVTVAGFMEKLEQTRPEEETADLKEVASNVYMDEQDNSIWVMSDNMLVRSVKEDLSELASVATPQPTVKRKPEHGLPSVDVYCGADNTHFICALDTVTSKINYGCRVDENYMYSADVGVTELAQNTVVDMLRLKGMDKTVNIEVATSASAEDMVEYYRKLTDYDPEYFEQMKNIIEERSIL